MKFKILYVRWTLFCFLAGFLSFILFALHAALAQANNSLLGLDAQTAARSSIYGTVESVDNADNVINIRILNPYDPSGNSFAVRVLVTAETFIAKQELIGDGKTYSSLSPLQPATFTDIPVGAHVRFLTSSARASDQNVRATSIIFGNPL